MKRGQLGAVIAIVLLVAILGAFVVFSHGKTGKAFSIAGQQSYPPQNIMTIPQQPAQTYIPTAQGPLYENPPPGVERKAGTVEKTEKPKCSYTCSCSSSIVEYKCTIPIDPDHPEGKRKTVPLSSSYPDDKGGVDANGVKGRSGTNVRGEPIVRCTATRPLPAPVTKTGMTDEDCTVEAKQKTCDAWAEKTCMSVFSDCLEHYLDECLAKAKAMGVKDTFALLEPSTRSTGKVGAAPAPVIAK